MKKIGLKIFIIFVLVNISVMSSYTIVFSSGATTEIKANFGEAPEIDGVIDDSTREWRDASKIQTNLTDLPVKLWVMQTNKDLFVSVQFDLLQGYHSSNEFLGLIISVNSSENQEDFYDAKFVQFLNISENSFSYLDYFVNNSLFINDTAYSGRGAGKVEGISSVYEFSIPINQNITEGNEGDVFLEYGKDYAFNISYGEDPVYPQGIKKSDIFLISINSPEIHEIIPLDVVLNSLTVIVFSIIGIFCVYYIYKIFKLKSKIQRLRG
ncbi:MAG: hypothetical protein ACXADU_00840 [Promethearchaeota archaeon]